MKPPNPTTQQEWRMMRRKMIVPVKSSREVYVAPSERKRHKEVEKESEEWLNFIFDLPCSAPAWDKRRWNAICARKAVSQ